MKKIFGIGAILVGAVLLTACGSSNKYTCSVTVTEGGESATQKVVTYLDSDDKVKSFDMVIELSSKESADAIYQIYSQIEGVNVVQDGKTITIKDAQDFQESGLELVGKTKDEVKEILAEEEPDVTCK